MLSWRKRVKSSTSPQDVACGEQKPRMPTVKFDPTNVTNSVREDLRKNIGSLTDIGFDKREAIYEAALGAIIVGGALNVLFEALISGGFEKKRAKEISHLLSGKAHALIERERQTRLGIKYAIWCYSGAPCGDKKQTAEHKAADGKRYALSEGLIVNGKYTWPGREDSCRCHARPLILDIDD